VDKNLFLGTEAKFGEPNFVNRCDGRSPNDRDD